MIKVKDLNLPEAPALAPQIDFGKDFDDFDTMQKILYLKKLCSALNHATDLIQKERNEALEEIERLKKAVDYADEAIAIQKSIVLKAITDHNAEKQKLIKTVQELETRVKAQDEVIERLNNGNNG